MSIWRYANAVDLGLASLVIHLCRAFLNYALQLILSEMQIIWPILGLIKQLLGPKVSSPLGRRFGTAYLVN